VVINFSSPAFKRPCHVKPPAAPATIFIGVASSALQPPSVAGPVRYSVRAIGLYVFAEIFKVSDTCGSIPSASTVAIIRASRLV